jgi:predicted metal-binding protein
MIIKTSALKNKSVPFKTGKGLSRELLSKIQITGGMHGWDSIVPCPTENIVTRHWVQLKCRYGCKNYNTNWCCPPASIDTEKAREILNEYETAIMLVGSQQCSSFYNKKNRKRLSQVRYWKETVSVERFLFLEGYYKAFSLVSGPCALCKNCGYPDHCYFPQERRPSMESFSIDVIATTEKLEIAAPTVANTIKDTYHHYAIILVE